MKIKIFFVLTILILIVSIISPVNAECETINKKLVCTLDNPLGEKNTNINTLIGTVIHAIIGIVGSLALAMFVYGGFTWMTAAGASDKVQKGKDIVIWATIGLIVIFSSYAMVSFVLNNVIGGDKVVAEEKK